MAMATRVDENGFGGKASNDDDIDEGWKELDGQAFNLRLLVVGPRTRRTSHGPKVLGSEVCDTAKFLTFPLKTLIARYVIAIGAANPRKYI
jgi:hypothetical protein